MNIVPSLHPWDESNLIMVYDVFNVLLAVVCQHFLRIFASIFISDMGLKFSLFIVSFSGLEIRMMLDSERVWETSVCLDFFKQSVKDSG